jgi:hypothetical protein
MVRDGKKGERVSYFEKSVKHNSSLGNPDDKANSPKGGGAKLKGLKL